MQLTATSCCIFLRIITDPKYYELQSEFAAILKDYVGRESPLYHADRLSEHYKKLVQCHCGVSAKAYRSSRCTGQKYSVTLFLLPFLQQGRAA